MFRRFLVLLWLALVGVVGLGSTGTATATTTPGAASYTYDGPALAHVEVHGSGVAGFSQTQLIGAPELSASPSVEAHRPPTTPLVSVVATNSAPTSDVLLNSSKQLQAKFKHAGDFGVAGNYSKANAAKYSAALNQHINSASVTKISGTYRGNPVTHHLDPSTGLNVIVDPSGVFVSGWKLNLAQLQNVLKHGGL